MYRKGVQLFKITSYNNVKESICKLVFKESYIVSSAQNKQWICLTCHRHIKQRKTPPQSKANGLELVVIPEPLQNLHPLEQRLLSLRIPFMKMVSVPKGKQKAIHCPAVNIPASLQPVCDLLPRLPQTAHLIPLKLKRKLEYKHAYLNNYIRPENNWTNIWQREDLDLWTALNHNPEDGQQPSAIEMTDTFEGGDKEELEGDTY